jgi:hypothetical protein
MFGYFRYNRAIEKRFRAIEDALEDMGSDIGTIRSAIARLNAKTAVEARKDKQSNPNKQALKMVAEMFGGDGAEVVLVDGKAVDEDEHGPN